MKLTDNATFCHLTAASGYCTGAPRRHRGLTSMWANRRCKNLQRRKIIQRANRIPALTVRFRILAKQERKEVSGINGESNFWVLFKDNVSDTKVKTTAPFTNQKAPCRNFKWVWLTPSSVASQRIHNGCSKEEKANNFQARRVSQKIWEKNY